MNLKGHSTAALHTSTMQPANTNSMIQFSCVHLDAPKSLGCSKHSPVRPSGGGEFACMRRWCTLRMKTITKQIMLIASSIDAAAGG